MAIELSDYPDVSAQKLRTVADVPAETPRMTGHAALEDADALRVSNETRSPARIWPTAGFEIGRTCDKLRTTLPGCGRRTCDYAAHRSNGTMS